MEPSANAEEGEEEGAVTFAAASLLELRSTDLTGSSNTLRLFYLVRREPMATGGMSDE
jgi:hypothetical protein